MRGKTLTAMLVMLMLTLAGCTENGGEETDEVDCATLLVQHESGEATEEDLEAAGCEAHHDDGEHSEDENETIVPNVTPVAVLKAYNAAGEELDNTMAIMEGETITFSAEGTADEDGTITLAGLAVQLGSEVVTATLMENDEATDFTVNFTGQGHIVAALSALDDDGARAVAVVDFYQNLVQTESFDIPAADPGAVEADACSGPGASADTPLIDNYYSQSQTFEVKNGTRWIHAVVVGDAAVEIAICGPDGEAVSGAGKDVSSTDEGTLTQSVDYYIWAVAREPQQAFDVEVTVHWEPQAAA